MEKQDAILKIRTIFEVGNVDFDEIAQALRIVMSTREDKEQILKAGMKKIKISLRKGEFEQLLGVNEFIDTLHLKIDVGKDIAEAISGLLVTVLPSIRLGVLENIAGIQITVDDMQRTVKDYLISSGMTDDKLSEKLINQIIEYRFVLAALKEKEVESILSFSDLIDALTLEKRIYRLKKAGVLDLLPDREKMTDESMRESIESILTQTVLNHPDILSKTEKNGLIFLLDLLQKKQISYATYPGETAISVVLATRDPETDEEIEWSNDALYMLQQTANLLGTKAVRYVRARSQFEEIHSGL